MPLYLLPNTFSDDQGADLLLPKGLPELLQSLHGLIAESERAGRRFLVKLLEGSPFSRSLPILLLNEHSSKEDCEALVEKITDGERWGMVSDAGTAGVADPGNDLVRLLRKKGYSAIHAIPGPCSILLALQLSGFSGQRFSFHGYLPRETGERKRALQHIENTSRQNDSTEIFIETPYRNGALFEDCLKTLSPKTLLAIATSLTLPGEGVLVHSIDHWKKINFEIKKEPTVFLLFSKGKV